MIEFIGIGCGFFLIFGTSVESLASAKEMGVFSFGLAF
jgi:hypothetical protein